MHVRRADFDLRLWHCRAAHKAFHLPYSTVNVLWIHTKTFPGKMHNAMHDSYFRSHRIEMVFFLLWNGENLPVPSIKFMPKPLNIRVEYESIWMKRKEWENEVRLTTNTSMHFDIESPRCTLWEFCADWRETKCDMIGFHSIFLDSFDGILMNVRRLRS